MTKNKDFLKSSARKSVLVYFRMHALFLFFLILVPTVIETQWKSGKWKVLINNLGFSTMHMALLLTTKWSSLTALILAHPTSHCHLGNVGSIPEIKFSRLTIGIIPSNTMSRITSSPLFKFRQTHCVPLWRYFPRVPHQDWWVQWRILIC